MSETLKGSAETPVLFHFLNIAMVWENCVVILLTNLDATGYEMPVISRFSMEKASFQMGCI
ncbi:hypothetical protein [Planktotalea sp.]|uniref:hypothetical protein n=1 Tax=Planktotalea sp. TaxID=2029877 RepID=UPI003C71492D